MADQQTYIMVGGFVAVVLLYYAKKGTGHSDPVSRASRQSRDTVLQQRGAMLNRGLQNREQLPLFGFRVDRDFQFQPSQY